MTNFVGNVMRERQMMLIVNKDINITTFFVCKQKNVMCFLITTSFLIITEPFQLYFLSRMTVKLVGIVMEPRKMYK
jgi:hypothetical protein